jgi:glycosyltransferase involved in cell wall biosynthesis
MSRPLRVLALATYPELGASTRYRILQYVPLLADEGIALDVKPFLSNATFAGLYDKHRRARSAIGVLAGIGRRTLDALRLGSYDLVFVQREAALVGPPVFEWLARRRVPLVLDLDDATYLDRRSDVYGPLVDAAKWPGKARRLIDWADHVVCGNPEIAAYVVGQRIPATVIPTVVDVDRYVPRPSRPAGDLVIGWIGTHSTFVYFRTLLPALRRLAATHRFTVGIVGAGAGEAPLDGLVADMRPWRLDRELDDLHSFDIGVYPIVAEQWALGKSGFKAVLYMACGIPYVASPVGVVAQMGIPGVTHFEARTEDEWVAALSRLLSDADLRTAMARQARAYAVEQFSIRRSAKMLGDVFRRTLATRHKAR